MWLEPIHAAQLKGGKKNGFLVSAKPADHAAHTKELLSRMPVAEELAKATDAAAKEAGLTDFDLARAAKVARDEGLDPRGALNSFRRWHGEGAREVSDGVVDVAKASMRVHGATTSKSRPRSGLGRARRQGRRRRAGPRRRRAGAKRPAAGRAGSAHATWGRTVDARAARAPAAAGRGPHVCC